MYFIHEKNFTRPQTGAKSPCSTTVTSHFRSCTPNCAFLLLPKHCARSNSATFKIFTLITFKDISHTQQPHSHSRHVLFWWNFTIIELKAKSVIGFNLMYQSDSSLCISILYLLQCMSLRMAYFLMTLTYMTYKCSTLHKVRLKIELPPFHEFLPGNTKWRTNCYRLRSSIKNEHFKEFWILILQYNNSLRTPWKRNAKIEAKTKRGRKESWIEPNGHNRDLSRIRLIVTPLL